MTKQEAEKILQDKLSQIQNLMAEAALIMDQFGVTASLGAMDYLPRGVTMDDDGYLGSTGLYVNDIAQETYDKYYAGRWMSSNSYKGC